MATNYADKNDCGPWGFSVESELGLQSSLNTSFSEFAWQSAKQEGCHYPCPYKKQDLPSWPPIGNFIYPEEQKGKQTVMGNCDYFPTNKNFCQDFSTPWTNKEAPRQSISQAMQRGNATLSENIANSLQSKCYDYKDFAEQDSAEEEEGDEKHLSSSSYSMESLTDLFPKMRDSVVGIAYDLAHYDELPSDNKVDYILVREERWKYSLMSFLFFLIFIFLIIAIICSACGGRNHHDGHGYHKQKIKLGEAPGGMEIYMKPRK